MLNGFLLLIKAKSLYAFNKLKASDVVVVVVSGTYWTALFHGEFVQASLYDRLIKGSDYAILVIFAARGADKLQIFLLLDLFQSIFSKLIIFLEVVFCQNQNNRLVLLYRLDFSDPYLFNAFVGIVLVFCEAEHKNICLFIPTHPLSLRISIILPGCILNHNF